MVRLIGFAASVAMFVTILSTSPAAQTQLLDQAFAPGGTVVLELSAGGYEIVGTPASKIRIESKKTGDRRARVSVDIKRNEATIAIDGPMTDGVEARIELPQRTNLVVKLTAGELHIRDIEGSKDVSARAGEIDINVGPREQYRRVDASVRIGELNAGAFNVNKEGFFRSFAWAGTGQYDLRAHLTVGELNLVR